MLQNLTLVGSKDRAQARPFEVEGSSRKAGLFYQLKGPVLESVRRWGLLRRRHEMVATEFVMQPQCEPNVAVGHSSRASLDFKLKLKKGRRSGIDFNLKIQDLAPTTAPPLRHWLSSERSLRTPIFGRAAISSSCWRFMLEMQ